MMAILRHWFKGGRSFKLYGVVGMLDVNCKYFTSFLMKVLHGNNFLFFTLCLCSVLNLVL